ncbi:MAG: tetratricopeptide repeat protein [Hyphomicrobiaceae bacterium]|nr:tetratricopeptide repeat protein [Hyphomicrobiaceae bacterium]
MNDIQLYERAITLRLLRLVMLLSSAIVFGSCAKSNGEDVFNLGLLTVSTFPSDTSDMEPEQAIEYYGSLYSTNPKSKKNALLYAAALREGGQKARAVSVLRTASAYHAKDLEFLSAYGRTTLDNDETNAAIKILAKADDPKHPDWRTVSARGTAYAKLGRYQDASQQFERALKLAPQNPSVMNNLAMAKAANGDLKLAEALLRKASQMPIIDPKVKQNLGLVLRLQGRTITEEK